MEEYSGSVLSADVITLAIEGSGVMGEPEDKEDMFIGDDIGVEGEVDCFGMAGFLRGYGLIGRVGLVSTGVAGFEGMDTLDILVDGFGAPEATGGKSGILHGLTF